MEYHSSLKGKKCAIFVRHVQRVLEDTVEFLTFNALCALPGRIPCRGNNLELTACLMARDSVCLLLGEFTHIPIYM